MPNVFEIPCPVVLPTDPLVGFDPRSSTVAGVWEVPAADPVPDVPTAGSVPVVASLVADPDDRFFIKSNTNIASIAATIIPIIMYI